MFTYFTLFYTQYTFNLTRYYAILLNPKCKAMRNFKQISRLICIYCFIILFVYAAVSKLIDFENFQVQIAQSPLLSAFATPIAYGVVLGELIIALLLCFSKTQKLGLYLFLGFMTAFSVYIYLILNYSPFVPCSCGGVLEKMGWTEHLWFNLGICLVTVFVIIASGEISPKRTILGKAQYTKGFRRSLDMV